MYQKYTENIAEYGEIAKSVTLQFENIAHRFEDFEASMEKNEYSEVTQIIKAIDDMLKHMEFVVDEVPSIVLMTTTVLPNKIKDIEKVEIIDKLKVKLRTNGIGMDEYSVGNFNVEGYGKCKLYIYNDVKPYILIESDNEQIFINGEDKEDTLRYYDEIIAVINKK